jgi:hypothetical protein
MSNVLTPAARGEAHSGAVARRRTVVGVLSACCGLILGLGFVGSAHADSAQGGPDASRGYELVSPPDKQGSSVDSKLTVQSAPDGDAVAYASTGAFPGATTNMLAAYYMGRRTGGNWTVDPIDAPQDNFGELLWHPSFFLSSDLRSTVQYSPFALAPGAIPQGGNLYKRDNLTGARSVLLASPDQPTIAHLAIIGDTALPAATDDLSHYLFASEGELVPGVNPNVSNWYEAVDGTVRLVNRLPDGSISPNGAKLETNIRGTHVISADGRRIFFNAGYNGGGPLYMRVDGQTTVPLSVSQRTGEEGTVADAAFLGASKDGTIVYFGSNSWLTDADNGGVYRLNVETNDLTLVAKDPFLSNSVRLSEDGSTFFFASWSDLTGGGEEWAGNIYMARDGELSLIGVGTADDAITGAQQASLSANGRYLAFVSAGSPGGFDNGGLTSVIVWDAERKQLSCASCDPQGEPRPASLTQESKVISAYVPRAALDDGRVFFSTAAKLVPEDVNGKEDVYQWREGVNTLISTGRGNGNARFQEVTPDGSSVYFTTADRLVGVDTDDDVDLYVARVGGGLAAQNVPPVEVPCTGEACQGTPQGKAGSPPSMGSVDFSGPGDAPLPPDAAGKATVSASKKAVRGSSFSIAVKAPAAGAVKVAGSGLTPVTKRLVKAGTVKVTVKLTKRARAQLKKRRVLKVKARVSYTQAGQPASTTTVSVTLKA